MRVPKSTSTWKDATADIAKAKQMSDFNMV